MKINLVPIGNSRGIRIPKTILEQLEIKKTVNIEFTSDRIIIFPVSKKPRSNWDKEYRKMNENKDDRLLINDNMDIDIDDWCW